jgi:hypothetical protein
MGKHKMNLIETLQRAVVEHGIYAVAQGSGVDYSVLLRFTKGQRTITLPVAAKLAEHLNLELKPTRKGR